jgi:hypothetical protein
VKKPVITSYLGVWYSKRYKGHAIFASVAPWTAALSRGSNTSGNSL